MVQLRGKSAVNPQWELPHGLIGVLREGVKGRSSSTLSVGQAIAVATQALPAARHKVWHAEGPCTERSCCGGDQMVTSQQC